VERGWLLLGNSRRRWPSEVETGRPIVVTERTVDTSGPSLRTVMPELDDLLELIL